MKKPKTKQSKGKQHAARAASFMRIAKAMGKIGWKEFERIFEKEAKYLRTILR